ncbi:MAG: phytoene desaturase family protein [Chloroflexota bacterium]
MSEKFDIVVIGAGLGGLSAAGYLAKAGKKVLVLEHHTVPGGYAHEFRRGKYRFEVALHAMDGAAPGGWAYPTLKDLGVLEQVHFHRLDPFYTAKFPDFEITAHADIALYEAELIKHFPHERQGIINIFADMLDTYAQVRRFGAEGEKGIRPPTEQMPALYPKMLKAMSMSWDEYMNQFLKDEKLKAALSNLWAYYGLPPQTLNAAIYIFPWASYHLAGAYYPKGGSMAISRALEATLKKHGGEIRYRQTVTRIEVRDGRAVAVETEKGLRVEAEVVVSNANVPDTMLKFIGRENLPAQYVQKIEAEKPSASNLVVYLGLDAVLQKEGWEHHEVFVHPHYDIAKNYEASMQGDFANAGIGLTYYDLADPGCSPEGGSVLNLFALADWKSDNQWGTGGSASTSLSASLTNYSDNPQYNEIKNAAADILITHAEKFFPNLRKHIKYMEVGTPITNWRYSRNTGGAIYGSEQSVDNAYFNRVQPKTPIANLFLAGAWTFGGGMSAALLSGRETSQLVLEQMDGRQAVLLTAPREVGSEQSSVISKQSSAGDDESPMKQLPVTNDRLPPMKAIGSNREVNLSKLGKPAILLFHTQETAAQAAAVNAALRSTSEYQSYDALFIANIVDLQSVPKLFRGFAEKAMKENYALAAASIANGLKPEDYVFILPDWDGSVTKSFGLKDTNKSAGAAALNREGVVIGVRQGKALEKEMAELLKDISK